MQTENLKAHKALDKLFNSVCNFSKDTKFISVQVENCTVFIPVLNLDESIVPEFRKRFKVVYDLTQGN